MSGSDARMSSKAAPLLEAETLLGAGRLAEAAVVSRSILKREPRNAIALHILGLAIKDTADVAEAERFLRLSIELAPRRPEFRANLANLMRRLGRLPEAESVYRQALALDPSHKPSRQSLVGMLNDLGQFPQAEAECKLLLAAGADDYQSWLFLGLTLTNLGRLAEGEAAYRQAIALNPGDAASHHNLGALLCRMERGEEALAMLERAQALGVSGFEMAFNRGRTLMQVYEMDGAEREFEAAVSFRPSDIEAQLNLTRLRFMRGDPKFARSIASAALENRNDVNVQLLFGEVLWRSGNLQAAEAVLRDLLKRNAGAARVRAVLASVLHESGRLPEAEAEALEAAIAAPQDAVVIETAVTVMLARGRAKDAMPFIQAQRARNPHDQGWIAYEATAARTLGSTSYEWLYDYERLVRTYELEPPPGWASMAELNEALLQALNHRHRFVGHPLDQSLRNGSQTARSLLTDRDPAIQAILQAFASPIEQYRQAIGTDPRHPLSARNTAAATITGAWSVRLQREGYHVNHFHPEGWISSAYYISVPEEANDATHKSGWIKFGQPRYPVPGADAEFFVQPKPGRLVLFPSYMWHGTNPIHGADPRMTIAFDATPG